MNDQRSEKIDWRQDGSLDVQSIFYTIQGEGPFVGSPAIFVRLAGCNLSCSGCDTDYISQRSRTSFEDLVSKILAYSCCGCKKPLVVLTGGEPFRQNFFPLVRRLFEFDFRVQVETNGFLKHAEGSEGFLMVAEALGSFVRGFSLVCSPKMPEVNNLVWRYCRAVKYVVAEGNMDEDGLPSRSVGLQYGRPARPPEWWQGEIFVQPLDENNAERNRKNVQAAVHSCLRYGYRLSLQVHKTLGLE